MNVEKRPDEHGDFNEFCEFVKSELGDIPVLDQGVFISRKIRYYWMVWRQHTDTTSLARMIRWDEMLRAKAFLLIYQRAQLQNSRR